ncbi:MAG: alanine racemase [Deltaproteobacteria bacterium]|nr:alanine racemase [Deltaproteobacteria bacterium]
MAEIDLDALGHNYSNIKGKAGDRKILAVVKANAYGHGAVKVSRELERLGADMLGVAILQEGIELRDAGIKKPILLLNGIFQGEAEVVLKYDLTPVVYSLETIEELSSEAERAGRIVPVHVKIDTGMKRLGILPDDIEYFFKRVKELKNIKIEGVLSHFATADNKDRGFMEEQFHVFSETINQIRSLGFSPDYIHIENSAAMIWDEFPDYLNLVRPGITLYGSYPSIWFRDKIELKPVMTLKSGIIQIKRISKGESVSYARKFIAERDSIIGVVPIGYADGYPRHLSNVGEVVVRGKMAKIAGLVCMDLIMIDITDIPEAVVGDEVVLWGRQGDMESFADELARRAGTISYELFCRVSGRVPRVYVRTKC